MEAIWTRFLPSIKKMLELINSGAIGEIRMIHADFGFPAPYDVNSRIFNPALAGGSLLDVGIYPLFLCLLILGEPKDFSAIASIGATGVDESLSMSMLFENGALAVLNSSVIVKTTTQAEIFGTLGKIKLNPRWFTQSSIELILHDENPIEYTFNQRSNGYDYEAEEVMRCLDLGLTESPELNLDFSMKLMKLMDAIRKKIGVKYEADN